jgi:hypothetical protein
MLLSNREDIGKTFIMLLAARPATREAAIAIAGDERKIVAWLNEGLADKTEIVISDLSSERSANALASLLRASPQLRVGIANLAKTDVALADAVNVLSEKMPQFPELGDSSAADSR